MKEKMDKSLWTYIIWLLAFPYSVTIIYSKLGEDIALMFGGIYLFIAAMVGVILSNKE